MAKIFPVGCGDPLPGSTVNASTLELPRSENMCVVDGVTAAVSIRHADTGLLSPTSHIW